MLNAHCVIGVTSFGTFGSGAFLIHKPNFGLVELLSSSFLLDLEGGRCCVGDPNGFGSSGLE